MLVSPRKNHCLAIVLVLNILISSFTLVSKAQNFGHGPVELKHNVRILRPIIPINREVFPAKAKPQSLSIQNQIAVTTVEVARSSGPAPAPISWQEEIQSNHNIDFDAEIVAQLKTGISDQRSAGHRNYNPARAYIVDPSKQELTIINLSSWQRELTLPVGTGKKGIGFGGAQTPIGFFTMGGVRIAKDANAYIQTGDSKSGVSGVYAEILYPPSHPSSRLRGRVPNNVIIHGFNPSASTMLRDRYQKKMIGRIPCTTGCPVPRIADLPKLSPYLMQSAGAFDPSSKPNSKLRALIRKKQVKEYSRTDRLGDPILILDRPFQ